MNGPAGLMTVFDAIDTANVKAGDGPGLKTLLAETLSKVKAATIAHTKYREELDTLIEVRRVRAAELADDKHTLNERIKAAVTEAIDNPASDLRATSQTLIAPERKVLLGQDVLDSIDFILLPAVKDREQESARDLKRLEHLESAIYAALSHVDVLERLEHAGVSQHGRVVVLSETTETLKRIADEAQRQAMQCDADLTTGRAARLLQQQHRQSMGITHAEAVFAALELSRTTSTTK
jgi:hypothetical protein